MQLEQAEQNEQPCRKQRGINWKKSISSLAASGGELNPLWGIKPDRRWTLFLVIAFPLICLALFARRPDWLLNQHLWAEDGSAWLKVGVDYGIRASFWPHSGYCQLLPKFVAGLFNKLNIYYAPLVFGLTGLAAMGLACWVVLTDFAGWFLDRPWRVIAAAALVLTPWQAETFHNLTGAQFYIFPAVALISLGRLNDLRWGGRAAVMGFMFVAVFSAPNTVLLLPILGLRSLARWRKPDFVVLLTGYTLALVAANAIISRTVYDTAGGLASDFYLKLDLLVPYLIKTFGVKTAALSLVGQKYAFKHVTHFDGWLAFSLGFVVLVGVHLWLSRRLKLSGGRADPVWGLVYFIIVPIMFSYFVRRWNVDYFIRQNGLEGATRYFVYPSYFFLIWLTALAQTAWRTAGGLTKKAAGPIRGAAIAVGLVFAWAAWANFTYDRLPNLYWYKAVGAYYRQLLKVDKYQTKKYEIRIMPSPQWRVPLPLTPLKPQERPRVEAMLKKLERMR